MRAWLPKINVWVFHHWKQMVQKYWKISSMVWEADMKSRNFLKAKLFILTDGLKCFDQLKYKSGDPWKICSNSRKTPDRVKNNKPAFRLT